ncbi:MAG: hypothetical protein HY560_09045 [Gemmatimonadetes bacterium]|nr:hypothetical protein [Gemmatimonadota bacterium]
MPTASGIIRRAFAVLTIVSAPIGFLVGDERWFALSAAFGTIWWVWDVLTEHVFAPLAGLAARLLEGGVDLPAPKVRPTLEDTVRLLHNHIEENAAREVQIQAAQRLADIYRGVYKDELRALEVIATVRARFPDADELS